MQDRGQDWLKGLYYLAISFLFEIQFVTQTASYTCSYDIYMYDVITQNSAACDILQLKPRAVSS